MRIDKQQLFQTVCPHCRYERTPTDDPGRKHRCPRCHQPYLQNPLKAKEVSVIRRPQLEEA